MIPQIICWISLPEIGYIVGIAVILFGCKAVSQNPFAAISSLAAVRCEAVKRGEQDIL